jgi:cell division transport system permease protein
VSRLSYFARETLISLRRNMVMTLSGIITIAVSATLLGGMLLYLRGNNHAAQLQMADVELDVYMNVRATTGEVTGVRNVLDQLVQAGQVRSYKYLSHQDAFDEAKKLFKDQPDVLTGLQPSDLPESFHVNPTRAQDTEAVGRRFDHQVGVYKVVTPARQVKVFLHQVDEGKYWITVIILALTVSSLFLVVTAIRLATYARRREIEVMKLVGASNWFVRIPFLAEGIVQGLVGAGIAFSFVFVMRSILTRMASQTSFFFLARFAVTDHDARVVGLYVLLGGVGVGVVGAALGLRRFLDV